MLGRRFAVDLRPTLFYDRDGEATLSPLAEDSDVQEALR
jgi:hypothetical protein